MNETPSSLLIIGGGLLAGIAAAAWSIWLTRVQSRKVKARFPNAEKAQWAVYLVLAALI